MATGQVSRPGLLRRRKAWATAAFLAMASSPSPTGSAGGVDLALVLGIDCSYSVDASEFKLQSRGYAEALVSPEVLAAIAEGPIGSIAVTVVHWSSRRSQEVVTPWTVIAGRSDAERVAATITASSRQSNDRATSISTFIDFGMRSLERSAPPAQRFAIDVASDGLNNDGEPVDAVRDRAVAAGITVNGLAIHEGTWWLDDYFRKHVIGGPGSFVIGIRSYRGFGEAIRRKLEREIRGATVS